MDEWYDDVTITCSNCRREYTWSGGRIKYMYGEVPNVCKTCYENPHLRPVTLICQNKSCGKPFEWTVGEQAFFEKKGFNQPALCKECREEKRHQNDVTIYCSVCNERRTIKKQYIISYRREIGPWSPPHLCRLCEEDPERVKHLTYEKESLQHLRRLRGQYRIDYYERQRSLGNSIKSLSSAFGKYIDPQTSTILSKPTSFEILDNAEVYMQLRDHRNGNALAHITKPEHKSAVKLGTNDGQTLIFMGKQIAQETNAKIVTQFVDKDTGYIIKRDNITGQIAIIRQFEYPPPPFRLTSTFQTTEKHVVSKIKQGAWVPSL